MKSNMLPAYGSPTAKELARLTPAERKIYDAILRSFPATDKLSAYDKAIQGGVKFEYNYH